MHCLTCGYDLRALEQDRCPECGRGFDAQDPKSWGNARAFRFRRIGVIAGWLSAVAIGLPAFITTIAMAIGRYDAFLLIILWMFAALPAFLLMSAWVGCVAACDNKPSWRALLVGVFLIALNLSLFTNWPIHLSFRMHRSALNQLVQTHESGQAIQYPVQVGLFRIHGIETIHWHNQTEPIIDLQLSPATAGPDHLVFGMNDQPEGQYRPFNIWSYQRLNQNWHIVHED